MIDLFAQELRTIHEQRWDAIHAYWSKCLREMEDEDDVQDV